VKKNTQVWLLFFRLNKAMCSGTFDKSKEKMLVCFKISAQLSAKNNRAEKRKKIKFSQIASHAI
jgi:hypothetical protein